MKKKSFILVTTILLAASFVFSACGSSSSKSTMAETASYSSDYEYAAAEEYDYEYESAVTLDGNTTADEVAENTSASNRKLIKTVNMNVETKEFEALLAGIEQQVNTTGGYVESSNIYNNNYYTNYRVNSRSASFTIRIPADKLDGFLEKVKGVSNVTSISQSVEDVTLNYVDMESRKKSLVVEQERILELMEQAESMEDIIVLEDKLENLRYEIQSMESQLRTYDNKIDYATVYINVEEVVELTVVDPETDGERLSRQFKENVATVFDGIKEFGIGFVVNIPFLIVWIIIIAIIVLIVRVIMKVSKKKKMKRMMKAQQNAMAMQAAQGQPQNPVQTQQPTDTQENK